MIVKEFNFLSKRYVALAISVILLLASLAALTFKGLNPGIDFTGGFSVEVSFQEPPVISEIRDELASGGFPEAIVQSFGSSKDINIRIMPRENIDNKAIGKQIEEILNNSANAVELRGSEFVSPQVGEELTEDGSLAMLMTSFSNTEEVTNWPFRSFVSCLCWINKTAMGLFKFLFVVSSIDFEPLLSSRIETAGLPSENVCEASIN